MNFDFFRWLNSLPFIASALISLFAICLLIILPFFLGAIAKRGSYNQRIKEYADFDTARKAAFTKCGVRCNCAYGDGKNWYWNINTQGNRVSRAECRSCKKTFQENELPGILKYNNLIAPVIKDLPDAFRIAEHPGGLLPTRVD